MLVPSPVGGVVDEVIEDAKLLSPEGDKAHGFAEAIAELLNDAVTVCGVSWCHGHTVSA